MTYVPGVYKTSGGSELVVATSGRILVESGGTLNLASGATLTLDGQALTSTGALTADSAAITGGITGSSGTVTNGWVASSGTFSATVAVSSGITALKIALTSGISATTGAFTGGIALTSGISGTTGGFSGAVTVGASLTASSGFIRANESAATGATTIMPYGVSQIWSSGTDTGHVFTMGAATGAGIEKWIVATFSTSTAPAVVTTSGGGTYIDGTLSQITFSTGATNRQWVFLLSENTTNWMTLAKSTGVTIA